MSILNWKIQFPDQAQDSGGAQTRLGTLASNDNLAVVTAAGYLNAIMSNAANQGYVPNQSLGYYPLPNDLWFISYSGGAGMFSLSISASNVLTLAPASNGYVQTALTLAQFLGMYAAPVLLVPAAGANQLIVVDEMEIIQTYGSAALASGGVVAAQYDNTAHGAGVLATNSEAAADFFVTASNSYLFEREVGALPFSTTVNKGIYLSNATGAFTTGTGSSFVVNTRFHLAKVA